MNFSDFLLRLQWRCLLHQPEILRISLSPTRLHHVRLPLKETPVCDVLFVSIEIRKFSSSHAVICAAALVALVCLHVHRV